MLHIISQTPLELAIIERLAYADEVIFIENAILSLLKQGQMHDKLTRLTSKVHCYALASDLDVRGITAQMIVAGIGIIDYPDFVQLTIENPVIQSWA